MKIEVEVIPMEPTGSVVIFCSFYSVKISRFEFESRDWVEFIEILELTALAFNFSLANVKWKISKPSIRHLGFWSNSELTRRVCFSHEPIFYLSDDSDKWKSEPDSSSINCWYFGLIPQAWVYRKTPTAFIDQSVDDWHSVLNGFK